ncbi:redoxin domain-containing protein [Spirosoma sp. HMF4905]|uniref:Glutathione peroxidase n=1 Tax=Spirosoma arboris TaxID=2682092 RepID=A0A7K1SBC4_9BACT|nr:glutathione peroxidase [Spirosoma arboris]MVM31065.1 redoxin domain-containing protein [Spirosoma arboris]
MKKNLIVSLVAVAVVFSLTSFMSFSVLVKGIFSDKRAALSAPANAPAPTKSLYDFTVNSLEGKPVALKAYKGKKVVILNVASKCGFTPQYADWEKFYKEHGDKVVVLGFPANNFKSQEPGTSEEIAEFCKKNYGVTFPMFEKVSVLGDDQAPLYKWLTTKSMNGWNEQVPTWNFCKYVINEKGELTNFFGSKVKPEDEEFKKAIGI